MPKTETTTSATTSATPAGDKVYKRDYLYLTKDGAVKQVNISHEPGAENKDLIESLVAGWVQCKPPESN